MDSGSTFPHRRRAIKTRGGDAGDKRVRVLDVPVPEARGGGSEALRRPAPRQGGSEWANPAEGRPRKAAGERAAARTETDTGGLAENAEAIGSTAVKELGKMDP